MIRINRCQILTHRIVWFMAYGAWPEDQIDHINRVKDDNRLENLRDVTCSENLFNRGFHGVSWDKTRNKWMVRFKDKNIGRFDDWFDAACCRKSAEQSNIVQLRATA